MRSPTRHINVQTCTCFFPLCYQLWNDMYFLFLILDHSVYDCLFLRFFNVTFWKDHPVFTLSSNENYLILAEYSGFWKMWKLPPHATVTWNMFMLSFLANTLKWQIPLFLSENFLTGFDEKETNWTTLVGGMKEWHVKYDSALSWVITWLEFGASLTRTRKVITEPFHNGIGGRWGSRRKDMANACSLIHRPSVMTVSIKSRCLPAKVNQSRPISCCISAQIGFPLWQRRNDALFAKYSRYGGTAWSFLLLLRAVLSCGQCCGRRW